MDIIWAEYLVGGATDQVGQGSNAGQPVGLEREWMGEGRQMQKGGAQVWSCQGGRRVRHSGEVRSGLWVQERSELRVQWDGYWHREGNEVPGIGWALCSGRKWSRHHPPLHPGTCCTVVISVLGRDHAGFKR